MGCKKISEDVILNKLDILIKHTITVTGNTDNFPKKLRFVLVNRMHDSVLRCYDLLYEAKETYGNYPAVIKKRNKLKKDAVLELDKLAHLIKISFEMNYINDRKTEYWYKLLRDVKYLTLAWIKSDK